MHRKVHAQYRTYYLVRAYIKPVEPSTTHFLDMIGTRDLSRTHKITHQDNMILCRCPHSERSSNPLAKYLPKGEKRRFVCLQLTNMKDTYFGEEGIVLGHTKTRCRLRIQLYQLNNGSTVVIRAPKSVVIVPWDPWDIWDEGGNKIKQLLFWLLKWSIWLWLFWLWLFW